MAAYLFSSLRDTEGSTWFRISGLGIRASSFGCRVYGLRRRISGSGIRD